MVTCRPSALKASQNGPLAEQPVSIVVAAGPYSLSNDLDYEPLEALIQQAKIERPNVLMLVSRVVSQIRAC
jgi:DNA polymerase alpha subunit B